LNRAILAGSVIVGIAVMLSMSMMPADAGGNVDIDIKPGSDTNPINLKSNGVIPVAILSSEVFDATTVNVSTLEFGPDNATPKHNGHLEDVNNDGLIDLVTHYVQKLTGIQAGDTEACIIGETFGGQIIGGCDSIAPISPE